MQKLLHFLDPRTRACRTEFILCLIFCFILQTAIPSVLEVAEEIGHKNLPINIISSLFFGIIFLIFFIRRLHDTGLRWIWIFLLIIPVVNLCSIIAFCIFPPNTFKKPEPQQPAPAPAPEPPPETETTDQETPTEPLPLTDLEQGLVDKYSALYQQYKNLTPEEATDLATTLIQEAKRESQDNHTYYLPTNLADLVLQNTPPADPDTKKAYDLIQQRLPRLRNEGVTDKDIRWWWNFSQIERSMIIKNDEYERHSFFLTQYQKLQHTFPTDDSAKNAAEALTNKRYPLYTQDLQDYFISPDDPLPIELKDRIDAFMDHAARFTDFHQTLTQIQQASTFNAFIRQQIQDKKL